MNNPLDKIDHINNILKEATDQEISEQFDDIKKDIEDIEEYINSNSDYLQKLKEKVSNLINSSRENETIDEPEIEILNTKIEAISIQLIAVKSKFAEYKQLCTERYKMHKIHRVKDGIEIIEDKPSLN